MDPKSIESEDVQLGIVETNADTTVKSSEFQSLNHEETPVEVIVEESTQPQVLNETVPVSEFSINDFPAITSEVEPSRDDRDPNAKVNLIAQDSEEGIQTYKVEVSPEVAEQCRRFDKEWDLDFRKFIGPEYPYTMSPQTTRIIAEVSKEIKQKMLDNGFDIDRWEVGDKETEPYVMGVLRRVCVPDTFEPIFDNTDKMARHLESIQEKDPSRTLHIRSFFTGAGVAEKCLVARLDQYKVKNFNLISTDVSAESIAIAALNLSVWNELLPAQERYDIRIVKGDIPQSLYSQSRTIILQVDDARAASRDESENKPSYDALLLDNGLPYVEAAFGSELVSNVAKNMGKDGLYVATLGLDAKIKVEISLGFHIENIMKKFLFGIDISNDKRIKKFTAPYEYPHFYGFKRYNTTKLDESTGEVETIKGNILINKVLSKGAGKTYNWLGTLFGTDLKKFKEVMGAIKSATSLSRAKNAVVTTPFESHVELVNTLNAQGYKFDEIERPLEFEKFGWQQTGEDSYTKNDQVVNASELMEICRQEDPLVLRKTILEIHPTQPEN